jgi:hypothetical protein
VPRPTSRARPHVAQPALAGLTRPPFAGRKTHVARRPASATQIVCGPTHRHTAWVGFSGTKARVGSYGFDLPHGPHP